MDTKNKRGVGVAVCNETDRRRKLNTKVETKHESKLDSNREEQMALRLKVR